VSHFEDAVPFCRRGYRGELVWTHADYAETLVSRNGPGDLRRAESLLRDGITLAEELGMDPLAERMQRALTELSTRAGDYPEGLTSREIEVLRLVARGFTNHEIGEELSISPLTAATHVHHILTKTGMANRAEVTAFAMRKGLLED
jgi:DNA-binding NarL/FixJ family response regulator